MLVLTASLSSDLCTIAFRPETISAGVLAGTKRPNHSTPSSRIACFAGGRHLRQDRCALWGGGCKCSQPDYQSILVWLAAAAARTGRDHEARDASVRLRRLQPDFTIASWLNFIRLVPTDAANLNDGLRRAGLPD